MFLSISSNFICKTIILFLNKEPFKNYLLNNYFVINTLY